METILTIIIIAGIILVYLTIGMLVLLAFIKWVDPLIVNDTGVRVMLWALWPITLAVEVCIFICHILIIISDWIFKILHLK